MPAPVFEYVPVFGDPNKGTVRVASLAGVSTKHGAKHNDRGRLYGTLTKPAADYTLSLYSDLARTQKVAEGTVAALGTWFDLAAQNASGISGRAVVDAYGADDTTILVLPTFATDRDVLIDAASCSKMPGWEGAWGLSDLHAQAVREILTSAIPAKLPHLCGGSGLASFVPHLAGSTLPDLTKLANVDHLRLAQAALVKALSAEQREHLEEFAAIAAAARQRYEDLMDGLAAANKPEEDEAAGEESGGLGVGTWTRR